MTIRVRYDGRSVGARRGLIRRPLRLVALPASVLAVGLAAPSAGSAAVLHEHVTGSLRAYSAARQGPPTQTIDAQADPQRAGQELNSGCADLSNCSWQTDPGTQITTKYGPFKIIGDALYNCADPSNEQAYSETAVSISDEREESTSLSESAAVEISAGVLGFEKASIEAEVNSKQLTAFSTEYTTTQATPVPPGYKGWNQYRVLTAYVSGSVYVTDGINLIQVKNIDLSYPGYQENGSANSPIDEVHYRTQMTQPGDPNVPPGQDDVTTRCNATGVGAIRGGMLPTSVTRLANPRGSLELILCQPDGRCEIRTVTGTPPAVVAEATATLAGAGRTYATGTDTNGQIRLTAQRPVEPGTYVLTISQRSSPSPGSRPRVRTTVTTVVPVAIR
jgi:hypothetical protein